jgi:hypothetical protein
MPGDLVERFGRPRIVGMLDAQLEFARCRADRRQQNADATPNLERFAFAHHPRHPDGTPRQQALAMSRPA